MRALLEKNEKPVGEITIRVVSIRDKDVEVKDGIREYYEQSPDGPFPTKLPYKAKCLFMWQKLDGVDVCFYG